MAINALRSWVRSLRLKIAMVLYRPLLHHSVPKWCNKQQWYSHESLSYAYEHYCQHKVRRIMVANYRVKLKTIRWKDVTYKQDASYLMRSCFLHILPEVVVFTWILIIYVRTRRNMRNVYLIHGIDVLKHDIIQIAL